jgi:hypothetical protein
MFAQLTPDLLDLSATETGHGSALYANVEIGLCCSLTCTTTSCS